MRWTAKSQSVLISTSGTSQCQSPSQVTRGGESAGLSGHTSSHWSVGRKGVPVGIVVEGLKVRVRVTGRQSEQKKGRSVSNGS